MCGLRWVELTIISINIGAMRIPVRFVGESTVYNLYDRTTSETLYSSDTQNQEWLYFTFIPSHT